MNRDRKKMTHRNKATVERKTLYLSEQAIARIEEYASTAECSLSSAADAIVLAWEKDETLSLILMVKAMMQTELAKHTNRLATLLAHASINAGMAHEMSCAIYFYMIQHTTEALIEEGKREVSLDEFHRLFSIGTTTITEKSAKDFFYARKRNHRIGVVRSLKKPIEEWSELARMLDDKS